MEKIKELFTVAVEYCKAEPFHAAILAGLAVFIVIILAIVIGLSVKYKKARKAADNIAKNAIAAVQETPTQASEPVAITKETPNAETPAPMETETSTEIEPDPVPMESEAPIEVKPDPVPMESKEKLTEEISEEKPVETEEAETQEEVRSETEAPTAPAAESSPLSEEKPVTEKSASEKPKNKVKNQKEGNMLHDELKDVDTDLDFYEEDETDRVARYSGKWVVCRVVTDDNSDEEMYFFELHASNGEKLLSSEEYTTYNGAIRGIETHKSNILRGNFRITLSKKGDYIFKLLNGKGMLLCMGEHYATKARCESAIESAKRFARTAFVDENIQDQVVKVPVEDDTPIEPAHDSYNGKWVIDCKISAEGEKVFYFELFANNGERLLSSEEYTSYIGAVNGIQTHKTNITKGNFRISLTKHGDYIYKLLNGNGQLLCLGEHYKTKRCCLNAVESVKRFAMNSPILADPELTK